MRFADHLRVLSPRMVWGVLLTLMTIVFSDAHVIAQERAEAERNLPPTLLTPMSDQAQLGLPAQWTAPPSNHRQSWMAQTSRDERLILTANESFFPTLGLVATGKGNIPDVSGLNKGRTFERIEQWDQGDTAEWGLLFKEAGTLKIRVAMSQKSETAEKSNAAEKSNGLFSIRLDRSSIDFQTTNSVHATIVCQGSLDVSEPGKHSLKLICNRSTPASFHWIELSGPAAKGGAVLRKRWRPAAAHTKFSSSESPQHIRLWVMEMDAVAGTLDFYSPITTPFGYYGPTWRADGTVNSQMNFSLWSYGRGKEAPPIEQQSHLLAIGNSDATFGEFAHEGTGVKVRDWHPLAGRQGQRQAFALRVEPGTPYDTYYSYYYASDQKRWRLFSIGNKFNDGKPIDSLWVGSFVEVPGPPHVQRTGPYPRVMRYRGWVMDENEQWFALDQMTNGNVDRKTGLTHTRRGVTPDGWFFLQTGGWEFFKPPTGRFTTLPHQPVKRGIGYLQQHMKESLMTVPSEISVAAASLHQGRVEATYRIRNLGRNATVSVFWGTEEALTFADRWQHQLQLDSFTDQSNETTGNSTHEITFGGIPAGKTIYFRLKLTNHEGQFWTRKTSIVQPLSK